MSQQLLEFCYLHFLSIEEAVSLWSGSVPVVRMLDHVKLGNLGLLLIILLLLLAFHTLPPGAQDLGDVRVVELRAGVQDLPSLVPRPDHEGVHRPLDVVLLLLVRLVLLLRYLGNSPGRCKVRPGLTDRNLIVLTEIERSLVLGQDTHHLPLLV